MSQLPGANVIVMTADNLINWAWENDVDTCLTNEILAQQYLSENSPISPFEKWKSDHNLQFIGLPESQLQELFKKFKTKN